MTNKNKYCGHPEWYREHLQEGQPTFAEQIAIVNDKRLPAEFRDEVRGELLEIKEEIERILIDNAETY
jgi:hypothetical protein